MTHEALLQRGASTRHSLAELTGLSLPSTSRIVRELRDEGYLLDGRDHLAKRESRRVVTNPALGVVGGLDLGGRSIVAVVTDLAGQVLAERRQGGRYDIESAASAVHDAVAWMTPCQRESQTRATLRTHTSVGALERGGDSCRRSMCRRLAVGPANDSAMSLAAEIDRGAATGLSDVALLMVGASLAAAFTSAAGSFAGLMARRARCLGSPSPAGCDPPSDHL
ncbi:winged helix-turn-helix transcriptional regulator [Leifsonia sp. 22587]|uniref:winged helix-turn-helix transcriptional regulator n=1 Tax=Leifsonia sp. 22587 TaxID=3453946 RepID=UPI003F84D1E9